MNALAKKSSRCRAAILLTIVNLLPGVPGAAFADEPAASVVQPDGAWAIMAGSSLKSTLEGWSRAAGWTLIWDSPLDYRIRASASFDGSFEVAAARLIDSIYQSNPELMATFHRGNRVLHVQDQPLSSN